VESVKRRIEDEKKELQLSIDRYSQREYKKGTGNVVFSHSNENPREAQNMSSLFITKRAGLACTGSSGHVLCYTPSPSGFHQLMHNRVRK
jgi:hypothetical protein